MYTEQQIRDAYHATIGFIETETGKDFSELASFDADSLLFDLLDVLTGKGIISDTINANTKGLDQ